MLQKQQEPVVLPTDPQATKEVTIMANQILPEAAS